MKCQAHKTDGTPGKAPAVPGPNVCYWNGATAPQVQKRAHERLLEAAIPGAKLLADIVADEQHDIAVRLRAAVAILHRTGHGPQAQGLRSAALWESRRGSLRAVSGWRKRNEA